MKFCFFIFSAQTIFANTKVQIPQDADFWSDFPHEDLANFLVEPNLENVARIRAEGLVSRTINEALADVQTAKVVNHTFLDGEFRNDEDESFDASAGYVVESGSIVEVEYENGTKFIVNYNSFPVVADVAEGETVEVDALSFVKIEG